MRAGVVDGEDLAVLGVEDRDGWVNLDPPGLAARKLCERTHWHHQVHLLIA
jgi:hypothetical protein